VGIKCIKSGLGTESANLFHFFAAARMPRQLCCGVRRRSFDSRANKNPHSSPKRSSRATTGCFNPKLRITRGCISPNTPIFWPASSMSAPRPGSSASCFRYTLSRFQSVAPFASNSRSCLDNRTYPQVLCLLLPHLLQGFGFGHLIATHQVFAMVLLLNPQATVPVFVRICSIGPIPAWFWSKVLKVL